MQNTATNQEQSVRMPLRHENETLLTMAKALDKYSVKNYASVLGVQNGKVYATDGYSMLRWTPTGDIGGDRTLNATLTPTSTTYPKCQGVWPSKPMYILPEPNQFNLMRKFLRPSWAGLRVVLRIFQLTSCLIPVDSYTKGLNAGLGTDFNPALFMKCCRGLPKDADCTQALFQKDERLLLKFESSVGIFEILLMAIKPKD